MSIKKLFETTNRNYLADSTAQEAFEDVESGRNVEALHLKQETFIPQVDYSNPAAFAKFGSAYLYYKSAMERVLDYYPYDGSDSEINEFYNKSLEIEKYIFNNLYPRTHGNIKLSSDGWGGLSGSLQSGYGLPTALEYIDFQGGPHTVDGVPTRDLFKNPKSSKIKSANIYDTDIYTNAGLPSDYGSGSRESNLKADFDKGVTIEFWAKTGSLDTSLTNKQVLVDIWNNELSASAYGGADGANPNSDYGRITLTFNGISAGSPFRLTAQSGATGISEQAIGTDIKVETFDDWKHYALVMQNTGSAFAYRLYVDGRINDINTVNFNINEINSKNMVARLGALLTAPSGAGGDAQEVENMVGAGKLSGSLDEFRYWKAARSGKEVGRDWFTQVRGGTNTDLSNTTLGIYYKFNEGITGVEATDKTVLDYSGRLSNGSWTTGSWSGNGRLTGSAIIEATASATEYKDPIIYATNPDVIAVKANLLDSGSYYDLNNNGAFKNLIPHWILEDSGEEVETNNLNMVTHIMATYFDRLHLLISALPKFKNDIYTSSSFSPLPFAQHLPQSLGLHTPEIFIDATIVESFLNRDTDSRFEGDLTETKNLIYLNLYNNLADIYKAKGTEKAIRNIFRCFNIDDKTLRLKTYAHNTLYTLSNNLQQTVVHKTSLNNNHSNSVGGVVYQIQNPSNSESRGYISGSGPLGYENKYGLTLEADLTFPRFFKSQDTLDRNFTNISLFGLYSASIDDETDTTTFSTDDANFQISAVRDPTNIKNVYFKLTSSITPFPIPELTSSTFFNVYDDTRWNLSLRLKPSNYPLTDIVTGSEGYTYDVVFQGINTLLGDVHDRFVLTSSISKATGQSLLESAKRVFVGAQRTNVTGAVIHQSDILYNGVRYWGKYLDDISLNQHLADINNRGISGSYQNISPLDPNNLNHDILNSNMLVLDWNFDNVTGSDSSGNFYVTDFSSGSALIRDNFGWVGGLAGYQHSGQGAYNASSSDVVVKEFANSFKFIDPEQVISSDMIQILSEDDKVFGIDKHIPSYIYTLEKSQYGAISEEMLQFFAGVVDFNNVIGEPVNRYRERYKTLEKLREIFFRRVTDIKQVEKFLAYYKWFDDALATIIGQLLPASSDFSADTFNTIESHVLERNKYKTQFPTLEFNTPDPEAPIVGIMEMTYPWNFGHSPLPDSTGERPTNINITYWSERATSSASEITSGDTTIDYQRNTVRDVIFKVPTLSQSFPILSTVGGTQYEGRKFLLERLPKTHKLEMDNVTNNRSRTIRGGVNFDPNKNIHFTYAAVYPAGPVNREDGVFIPENVLLAEAQDFVGLPENNDQKNLNKKVKRSVKVQYGRNWEDGLGYYNVKSNIAFPFNIMSSSVTTGYNASVVSRVTSAIQITNLHNDVYGWDMEVPMQGPFTNYAVGGHQSRHIALNASSSLNTFFHGGLDSYLTRPEAWKLLLGKCDSTSGAIGMVGADYPYPEANEPDIRPYPVTGAQKAVYYRDFIAKRPVNIRNIQLRTGSTILGNYTKNYEVVSTVGAYSNPRSFVEQQPTLPDVITAPTASNIKYTTQVNTLINLHRGSGSHFEIPLDYEPVQLTGSNNKSIIVGRFAAPGGPEIMSRGFEDIKSSEFSAYNALPYRNLTVKKPSQGPSGTISVPTGEGIPGIRVNDIHGKDFGLQALLARHTARFGRDSLDLGTTVFPAVSTYTLDDGTAADLDLKTVILEDADGLVHTITFKTSVLQASSTSADAGLSDSDNSIKFALQSLLRSIALAKAASVINMTAAFSHGSTTTLELTMGTRGESGNGLIITGTTISHGLAATVAFIRGGTRTYIPVDAPGASYAQNPSFHKVHRNTKTIARMPMTAGTNFSVGQRPETASLYDNFFVQYPIPRMARQYSWITSSLMHYGKYDLLRYYGIPPLEGDTTGLYSSSADGYVAYFDFVSSSEIFSPLRPNAVQPTTRLNTLTVEPVSGGTDNIVGFPTDAFDNNAGIYFNAEFINSFNVGMTTPVSSAVATTQANYFNLLMARRNNTFGWNWRSAPGRQDDNPILMAERISCSITVETASLARFRLASVSMRGRPTEMCWNDYDAVELHNYTEDLPEASETISVKSTNNNWKVFFNEAKLDDLQFPDVSITTPFDQLLNIVLSNPYYMIDSLEEITAQDDVYDGYDLQWITYTENVFPSLYNEFNSSSTSRIGYDNEFWRDGEIARQALGATLPNSFNKGTTVYGPSPNYTTVSQSSWPLDAPKNFLTRTTPTTVSNTNSLTAGGKAGELQNTYFHVWRPTGTELNWSNRIKVLSPAGLYSRKHLLSSPPSVVAPSGVRIQETASTGWLPFDKVFFATLPGDAGNLETGSGEALWEADTQAGYSTPVETPFGVTAYYEFNSAPSEPWFDEYADFKSELKLVAKDFSIVPEFRISNHIEDYMNNGVIQLGKYDTLEIPGTEFSSSYSGFYKDFSNSEFMKDFISIQSVLEDNGQDVEAREIRLICKAAIRFNPYKGFYPAQRTIDLISQFSSSFGSGMSFVYHTDTTSAPSPGKAFEPMINDWGGVFRPLMQPLFSPGILYNSIKSGIAVDYPVVTNAGKISASVEGVWYGVEGNPQYALGPMVPQKSYSYSVPEGYISGAFWDQRIPFEAIVSPSTYLSDTTFYDMEPHPSASLRVTASLGTNEGSVYELMARNFFGEVANLFLEDGELSSIKSGWWNEGATIQFGSDEVYGARLKMRRSMTGPRTYGDESGSGGSNVPFGKEGAIAWDEVQAAQTGQKCEGFASGNVFPIPQDPYLNPEYKETWTMYSRPSAFGPPCAGRPIFETAAAVAVVKRRPQDCFAGFNWSFTPPYYHGEAWVDFVFWPQANKDYTLQTILAELSTSYWRADPGILTSSTGTDHDTALISSFPEAAYSMAHPGKDPGGINSVAFRSIYDGRNINHNAMQISASLNLFGIESRPQFELDKFGGLGKTTSIVGAERWVIQPKWETPIMNFNDEGLHPITDAAGNLSVPNWGEASVPRGMWHQFGIPVEGSTEKGIFISIDEIPNDWLQFHYDVVSSSTPPAEGGGSIYNLNNNNEQQSNIYEKMDSLTDLLDFGSSTSTRLGALAEEVTFREAVVAVPYINKSPLTSTSRGTGSPSYLSEQKEFISIPQARIDAALEAAEGSEVGDTLESAGESIRTLVQTMDRYVLPPQFDFLNNDRVDPIVMYMFEFEYTLDKIDLSYIWQNVAPKDYQQITFAEASVAHELNFNELLSAGNVLNNEDLRWMVFKVKQKAQTNYWDQVASQMGRSPAAASPIVDPDETGYPIAYNWPYDFLSFVELIKLDVEVGYNTSEALELATSEFSTADAFGVLDEAPPAALTALGPSGLPSRGATTPISAFIETVAADAGVIGQPCDNNSDCVVGTCKAGKCAV